MANHTAENVANLIIEKGLLNQFHALLQNISIAITKYESAIENLEEIRAEIQKHEENVKIARGVGAGAAAVATVGGLIAAPFTGGLSLVASLTTLAGVGSIINGASAAIGAEFHAGLVNKASQLLDECKFAEEEVRSSYRIFDEKCTGLLETLPHLKKRFSIRDNSWILVIAAGCMAGVAAIARFAGIGANYSKFLTNSCGVAFEAGLVPRIKATIAVAINECTSVATFAYGAVTSSSAAVALTLAVVGATFVFNIHTLVSLLNDNSPSTAEKEVSTAITDLKQRKDGMASLLKDLKEVNIAKYQRKT